MGLFLLEKLSFSKSWGNHKQQTVLISHWDLPYPLNSCSAYFSNLFLSPDFYTFLCSTSVLAFEICVLASTYSIFWDETLIMQKSCFAFASAPQTAVILHTWPFFSHPQQEKIEQTSSNHRINNHQPSKQCSIDQKNIKQKMTNKNIFDQLEKKTHLPPEFCATFFTVVRLLIPETSHITTFSSCKFDYI